MQLPRLSKLQGFPSSAMLHALQQASLTCKVILGTHGQHSAAGGREGRHCCPLQTKKLAFCCTSCWRAALEALQSFSGAPAGLLAARWRSSCRYQAVTKWLISSLRLLKPGAEGRCTLTAGITADAGTARELRKPRRMLWMLIKHSALCCRALCSPTQRIVFVLCVSCRLLCSLLHGTLAEA